MRFWFNLILGGLFFCFGFFVAFWIFTTMSGSGVFYTMKSLTSIALVIIAANAKMIFLGHLVISALRDIKNSLGL